MTVLKDLRSFLIVWFGQMLSLTGTGMKRFALMIWAYQQTGDALSLTLLGFFSFIGYVIISPVAGILVDKFNRRWVMFFADLGAGLVTIVLMLLFISGGLELWHLYLAEFIIGTLEAFQVTAYSAAISTLIPQKHYARGNALRSIAYYSSEIAAPFLGGLLLTIADIEVVLMVDIVTFIIGLTTLMLVKFPAVKKSTEETGTTWWQKITFGWRYIVQRPGLFWLMMFMLMVNLFASLTYFSVLPVLILERTGGDELALATVQSILGVGGVIGGIVVSVWGGPKRLIHGVLFCTGVSFLFGDFLFAVGLSLPVWIAAASVAAFFIPFITTSERTIWQRKVPMDVQGRVFATSGMIRESMMPFGFLAGGFLADSVFTPGMMADGALAPIFGGLVGTGDGAGIGLMFLFTALAGASLAFGAYFIPALRNVEDNLPDVPEVEMS